MPLGNYEQHIEGGNPYSINSGADASTDASVKSPVATRFMCVYRVVFGYSDDPGVNGRLQVWERDAGDTADATKLFEVPVTKSGTGPIDVNCKALTVACKLRVALVATGTGVPFLNCHFGEENNAS